MNSRVSSKIQQLLDTLKRPKRPPLREFFLDDAEEVLGGERLVGSRGAGWASHGGRCYDLTARRSHCPCWQLWLPCGGDGSSGPLPAELTVWEAGCPWLWVLLLCAPGAPFAVCRKALEASPCISLTF